MTLLAFLALQTGAAQQTTTSQLVALSSTRDEEAEVSNMVRESYDSGEFQLQLRGLQDEEVSETEVAVPVSDNFVRAQIKEINNGGQVFLKFDKEIEFPSDIIDKLNGDKDAYVRMQVVREGTYPEPLPDTLPEKVTASVSVGADADADASTNTEAETTMEPEDEEPTTEEDGATTEVSVVEGTSVAEVDERAEFQLVDWEALEFEGKTMILRVLWEDASIISAIEGETDKLFITLRLDEFKTAGGEYIPRDSQFSMNCPAQLDLATAETYELIGAIVGPVFMALMLANGGLNSVFEELDLSTLFDAVEGAQNNAFLPAMDFKMPPNINYFFAQVWAAVSIDTESAVLETVDDHMADGALGDNLPLSEPLNDEVATIGYDNTAPLAQIGTISVMMMLQVACLLIMLLGAFCHTKIGTMLSERVQQNFESFTLWGSIIDLILIAYLPVCVAMFISTVGMQWDVMNNSVLLNNTWTIFMLHAWLLCPIFMFIVLFRNRKNIAIKTKPVEKLGGDGLQQQEEEKKDRNGGQALANGQAGPVEKDHRRDPMKIKWLRDYATILSLKEQGKNPDGLIAACRARKQHKSQADSVDRVQPMPLQAQQQEEEEPIEASSAQARQYEGGEVEEAPLMNNANDSEDPEKRQRTFKKNAWKLFGKRLPVWLVPRKRDKGIARMKQDVPVNVGVSGGDFSKEHPWSGPTDKNYGEFYKKMNLNQKKVPREAAIFYNFWNIYRKLVFAACLVFFKNFRVQAYTQIATSSIMTAYVLNYWPCARYVDNVSKIVNEVCFMAMIVNCAYIKEMGKSLNKFDPSNSSPSATFSGTGNVMLAIMFLNMGFHSVRMIHNAVQAAKTIKMRRQQIASKWMGPPCHNDPEYSTDFDSGEDDLPEPIVEVIPDLDIDEEALMKVPVGVEDKSGDMQNEMLERSLFPQPFHDVSSPDIPFPPPVIEEPEPIVVEGPDEEVGDTVIEIDEPVVIELEIEEPYLYGEIPLPKSIEELQVTMEETVWDEEMADVRPEMFWKDNELEIEIPELPGKVPGEPKVHAEQVVIGNDVDDIKLEYEVVFPEVCKDFPPNLPGADTVPDLPQPPMATPDLPQYEIEEETFPSNFVEKARIPKMPATIYDNGKMTLGKPPKPLKPKMFQKVINTIPMPMKIKNIPFKPVGEPRTQRQPKQTSPTRVVVPNQVEDFGMEIMPVRKPEKNQIALQQLTLADQQRFERVILGDVDVQVENLLTTLMTQGKIQAFRLQGSQEDPQAEVILNGGLVNMSKFTQMNKKTEIQHNLGRVTNQLLHEQMVRTQYSTTKGQDRVNSASPDARHPARQSNNFVKSVNGNNESSQEWGIEDPARKQLTFNEMHSPIVKALSRRSLEAGDQVSPKIDLEPMVRANHSRKQEARIIENDRRRNGQDSREAGSRNEFRPQTNSDANRSPYRTPESRQNEESEGQ